MKANTILDLIGNTPHMKLGRLFGSSVSVWIKLERFNPGASIKDRIALAMINDAEERGVLRPGGTIIEPTSGNTGIGLAMVAAVKGYRIILVMPESMSVERRRLMIAYGAEVDLSPREKGMNGAIERASQLREEFPGSWIPMQFENPSNPEIHRRTTVREILADFPGGIDYLVAAVGTGGHITGCAEVLKQSFPGLKVFAVEPALSPVLSGGGAAPHPLQGIGAGFVPPVLNTKIIDEVITVDRDESFEFARRVAKEEGLLAGISTGAVLAAVNRKLHDFADGATVLTFNYDTGERYLSTDGLF